MARFADIIAKAMREPNIDDAVRPIQEFLGIEDGMLAGIVFSDYAETWPGMLPWGRKQALIEWISAEISIMGDH